MFRVGPWPMVGPKKPVINGVIASLLGVITPLLGGYNCISRGL